MEPSKESAGKKGFQITDKDKKDVRLALLILTDRKH